MIYQQNVAFAGMKADAGFDRVESFPAAGNIGFGCVCGVNASNQVVAGAGTRIAGIALHSHTIRDQYTQYDEVSVMTRGLVWAPVVDGGAVTDGGPVQFDSTGAVGDAAGTVYPNAVFRGDAVTRNDGVVIACVELHSPTATTSASA